MSPKEAYELGSEQLKTATIINMAEAENCFIFGIKTDDPALRGQNGYSIIDKKTGELGFMWMMDYADLVDKNALVEIDISSFRKDMNHLEPQVTD